MFETVACTEISSLLVVTFNDIAQKKERSIQIVIN